MKKLIVTCALLTAASMVSFAQTTTTTTTTGMDANGAQQTAAHPHASLPISAAQMAERRAKMDVKQFGLTDDQYKGVLDIETEYTNALERYHAEGKQPNIGQMGNLNARKDAKMKAIMSPEQYAKYDEMRSKDRRQPMTPATQMQPGK